MGPVSILVVQASAAAASFCIGALPVLRRTRRGDPVRARDLVAAGAAVAVTTGGACVAGLFVGLGAFGWIRLLYTAAVVVIPAIALVTIALRMRGWLRLSRSGGPLAAAALLLAPLGAWMSFGEPNRLVVETATLELAPQRAGSEPVRVGVLTDLQCNRVGDHERAAVDLLLAQRPDVILLPGDVFHGWQAEWDRWQDDLHALLARLDAPGGVYFVMGDVDGTRTFDALRGTKVRVIENEIVRTTVRGRTLSIGGIAFQSDRTGVARRLAEQPGESDVRILLCHKPDHALELPPHCRIDLVVAGHTHGGQVVIPGFGPPMTLSRVPRHVAAGGLHEIAGNRIYVSRGVGMERTQAPPMRLFCTPEVSVVTLTGGTPAAR